MNSSVRNHATLYEKLHDAYKIQKLHIKYDNATVFLLIHILCIFFILKIICPKYIYIYIDIYQKIQRGDWESYEVRNHVPRHYEWIFTFEKQDIEDLSLVNLRIVVSLCVKILQAPGEKRRTYFQQLSFNRGINLFCTILVISGVIIASVRTLKAA